jgi:hypothetical protein
MRPSSFEKSYGFFTLDLDGWQQPVTAIFDVTSFLLRNLGWESGGSKKCLPPPD